MSDTHNSYKEDLKTLRGNLTQMLPADALEVFDNDASQLQASQQSILKLQTGDTAPDFSLSNAANETVRLYDLLEESRVILVFYRGTWCPYCNLQLSHYRQHMDNFTKHNAQLVAVSPQTPDESMNIKEKNELDFHVLSDNGNMVARNFTQVFKNADQPIDTMTNLGFDFDSHYADDSREIPVPAVFIIDQDHKVTFAASTGGDYRNRVEATDIINSLK
ncbi:peroxiredoxin family protein [Nonlabens ponticola]|uniref:thioredoxin-dependent peroxiredoxin n=1 Tax=Nonlabens ponticola TaxID=2496866 RepID=A0A3S9MW94_9FLAO|nr:peroxiredoxin family protein [Nonlabens ponticola]AZQ43496.1 AhpC/TSA family protein [Nonlabens ponticola]